MNKIAKALLCIVIIVITIVPFAVAEEIAPHADDVFDAITATLTSTGGVSFNCATFDIQKSIKMTDCWLQIKTGTRWSKVCDLEVPSKVVTNTFVYTDYMDYSDSIGTGTYRVGFTMDADGHTVTRYSNERTFE